MNFFQEIIKLNQKQDSEKKSQGNEKSKKDNNQCLNKARNVLSEIIKKQMVSFDGRQLHESHVENIKQKISTQVQQNQGKQPQMRLAQQLFSKILKSRSDQVQHTKHLGLPSANMNLNYIKIQADRICSTLKKENKNIGSCLNPIYKLEIWINASKGQNFSTRNSLRVQKQFKYDEVDLNDPDSDYEDDTVQVMAGNRELLYPFEEADAKSRNSHSDSYQIQLSLSVYEGDISKQRKQQQMALKKQLSQAPRSSKRHSIKEAILEKDLKREKRVIYKAKPIRFSLQKFLKYPNRVQKITIDFIDERVEQVKKQVKRKQQQKADVSDQERKLSKLSRDGTVEIELMFLPQIKFWISLRSISVKTAIFAKSYFLYIRCQGIQKGFKLQLSQWHVYRNEESFERALEWYLFLPCQKDKIQFYLVPDDLENGHMSITELDAYSIFYDQLIVDEEGYLLKELVEENQDMGEISMNETLYPKNAKVFDETTQAKLTFGMELKCRSRMQGGAMERESDEEKEEDDSGKDNKQKMEPKGAENSSTIQVGKQSQALNNEGKVEEMENDSFVQFSKVDLNQK